MSIFSLTKPLNAGLSILLAHFTCEMSVKIESYYFIKLKFSTCPQLKLLFRTINSVTIQFHDLCTSPQVRVTPKKI